MGIVKFRYCPKCNALFDCYCESDKECWCAEVKLKHETLEKLAKIYAGCLCPSCLGAIAMEKDLQTFSN